MLGKAAELGCPNGTNDPSCLCKNVNFGYGLRDCSLQACGAAQESAVVAYGTEYCSCTYMNPRVAGLRVHSVEKCGC